MQGLGRVGLDDRWVLSPMPQSTGWIAQLAELMPLGASTATTATETASASASATAAAPVGAVILRTASLRSFDANLPHIDLATVLKREEADIEDLMIPEFYMRIIALAFDLQEADAMSQAELPVDILPTRLLPLVETAFQHIAPKGKVFKPEVAAWYLFHHRELLTNAADSEADETLERAERLIQAINQRLSPED